ncbi:hypothetical protein [Sphingopyxis sp.]|uniref:hypothetical protein n=1 Tax=Sphingopyxis sp. TaxID=1908224 RepID=UPI003D0EA517
MTGGRRRISGEGVSDAGAGVVMPGRGRTGPVGSIGGGLRRSCPASGATAVSGEVITGTLLRGTTRTGSGEASGGEVTTGRRRRGATSSRGGAASGGDAVITGARRILGVAGVTTGVVTTGARLICPVVRGGGGAGVDPSALSTRTSSSTGAGVGAGVGNTIGRRIRCGGVWAAAPFTTKSANRPAMAV